MSGLRHGWTPTASLMVGAKPFVKVGVVRRYKTEGFGNCGAPQIRRKFVEQCIKIIFNNKPVRGLMSQSFGYNDCCISVYTIAKTIPFLLYNSDKKIHRVTKDGNRCHEIVCGSNNNTKTI